ncbi:MAG: SpoIID/LytB domain-containing protein [Armatimonadota bacterium]|nr:MAG: SpoIID/LytB domain-containing protein [Armatimonadota bacterium]
MMRAGLMLRKLGVLVGWVAGMWVSGVGECAGDQVIRVGLTYGQAPGSVAISGKGDWRARKFREKLDGTARITAGRGELVLEIEDRHGGVGPWIEFGAADERKALKLDGRRYLGRLRVELADGGGLKVINTVGVEDYVRGVVPNEMFAHSEAFKVQAVVARTYALYVRDIEKKHEAEGFDICTTGHCQVYRGVDSQMESSDRAVRATEGEVLTYGGRPIFSAYHANAGGMTQWVDEAWPGSVRRDFPYLRAVASPYDAEARKLRGYEWCYRWKRRVKGREIEERLRARGKRVGDVRALLVRKRTSTGRVGEMEVVGTKGRARLGTPAEVKRAVRTPSANFEVAGGGGRFELTGWGRGHGVGMSQHGALGMAKAGYKYQDILGHFYWGVSLTEGYGGSRSRALRAPELRMKKAEVAPIMVPKGRS